jgi:hypothetical protein
MNMDINNSRCQGCIPSKCWNEESCEALKPALLRAIKENYRLDCTKNKKKEETR